MASRLSRWSIALSCSCAAFSLASCGSGDTGQSPLRVLASPAKLRLDQVRSYVYALAANTGTAGYEQAIGRSNVDMVIMGGGTYDPPLNRSLADPTGTKLLCGYLPVGIAADYMFPEFFAGGTRPSWFGNLEIGFPGHYTVQYWNPAWQTALLSRVDLIIQRGYDCVFLDVLDADQRWNSGNRFGNSAYAEATAALVTLLASIRGHVDAKQLASPFYLIGNNPVGIALHDAQALRKLDGIFHEWLYWAGTAADGTVVEYKGDAPARYTDMVYVPLYRSSGLPVFGNDYPPAREDSQQVLPSFEFYSTRGWLPSVVPIEAPKNIFTAGPFLYMAQPANPTVTGSRGSRNYMSGGTTLEATLVGGDQDDVFIGGPGRNDIHGAGGDDVIYAHPASAALRDQLQVTLSSTIAGGSTPSVVIRINGRVAAGPVQVTAAFGTSAQEFAFTGVTPVSGLTLELEISGASYTDAQQFSNVQIESVRLGGQSVSLASAHYENGASTPNYTYSNNGKVTFAAASFSSLPGHPEDNRSTIDGGSGTNTVVYRSNYAAYTISRAPDGSWLVSSGTTAEGPDTLRNVQKLKFRDVTVELAAPTFSTERVFAFAASKFPDLFPGTPSLGSYAQFEYAYFPGSGNYVALDALGGVWVLGPLSGGALQHVGMVSAFAGAIAEWEAGR